MRSTREEDACPKCSAVGRERGELYPKGVLWDIRFKEETESVFSAKKKVVAMACSSCGHIELFLADHAPR